jgi:hypothetical protein
MKSANEIYRLYTTLSGLKKQALENLYRAEDDYSLVSRWYEGLDEETYFAIEDKAEALFNEVEHKKNEAEWKLRKLEDAVAHAERLYEALEDLEDAEAGLI